ncbi:flagellar protein [Halobacteriovorax sp. HFRX-2_2]|uniref:flagellar protein n=1 Tax=unclassified Halobacteriovorax TaxID=2639665 RepID=UPI00371412B1
MERVTHQLTISKHAKKRLLERQIHFSEIDYSRLNEAAHKLKLKGSKESLVITDEAAFILDIDRYCLITAVNKDELSDNIFTKIDATMIL